MSVVENWTIEGSAGEPIIGNTHRPDGDPIGAMLIAHGFKGYKDYGMFPRIAVEMAGRGLIAHRFNFSHAGMTDNLETFERPDLFENDTWNRQVEDLRAVMNAVEDGTLSGRGLPLVIFGHSRGGVTALLAAGRFAGDASVTQPAGVATASAPHACNFLSKAESKLLLEQGFLVSPSSRTGQQLRIGRAFLDEQLADPDAHDLLTLVARITCPVLLVHGELDSTVPTFCASRIAEALTDLPRIEIVPGADHVYNTPNPMPPDAEPSPQLRELLTALGDFAQDCCA